MELLFGGMPDVARFVVAFMLVLGLIGAGTLLWRRFGVGPLSPIIGPRGRQPRLAVIDAASVDGRRRLVLVRRDNTEHLLMIGGPTDIVIEPNISRTGAGAASREPRPIRSMEELDSRAEPSGRSAREAMAESMRSMRSEPATRASEPVGRASEP